jgi:hypothetical protein
MGSSKSENPTQIQQTEEAERTKPKSKWKSRLQTAAKVILGVGLLTAGLMFPPLGAALFIGAAMYGAYKAFSKGGFRSSNPNPNVRVYVNGHEAQSRGNGIYEHQLQQAQSNPLPHQQQVRRAQESHGQQGYTKGREEYTSRKSPPTVPRIGGGAQNHNHKSQSQITITR